MTTQLQSASCVTITEFARPAPERVLRLNSAVDGETQAAALPCLRAAPVRQLAIPKSKVIAHIKATFRLLEIQQSFVPDAQRWDDPLSKAILDWAIDFNDFVEHTLLPSRRAIEEVLDEALAGLEHRIDRLFNNILRDPMEHTMEHPKVLDQPVMEGGLYMWSEALFKKYQACTPLSPYTEQPFDAKPHLLARAILEWGKEFFPAYFTQPDTTSAAPLNACDFKVIKKNAKVLVKYHRACRQREEAERVSQAAEAFARGTHASNFQALLQRSIQVENQFQTESDRRCERLNQRILQMTEFFESAIAGLRVELANTRADNSEIQAKLVRLEIYAAALKGRNEALACEIGMLRQSLSCAHQRMNDDGGGSCTIM